MQFYKKNTWLFAHVLIVISTVFSLQQLITPMSYTVNAEFKTTDNLGTEHRSTFPIRLNSNASYFTEIASNEIWTEIIFSSFVNKNVRDLKRYVNRISDTPVLPLISIGIILLIFSYIFRKAFRTKSVLAYSLGGHAPPGL